MVHEKVALEDGGKSQRVDIHYKFIGYFSMEEWLAGADSISGIPMEELAERLEQAGA
ncbi:hypothetical protein FACS1894191_8450 [Clostridia bacterium]|nr:hypothetical protein FACS1894191_8450 [Clostridia bacterium]